MSYDDWKSTNPGDQGEPPVACPTCGAEDSGTCRCGETPCDWCRDEATEHCAVCGQDLCADHRAKHGRDCREQAADERANDRASYYEEG